MSLSLIRNNAALQRFTFTSSLPTPIRSVAGLSGNDGGEKLSRAVCLTFDDGPDPVYTPKILNMLAHFNVKATFFVMGEAAEAHPGLLEKMIDAGHTVGNHTYSHRHPWTITSARAIQEVARTTAVIENIIGKAPRWFRPPFGRLRSAMRKQAHVEQMATVLWNHSIIDWGPLGTAAGILQRLDQIVAGDIVLMHDGKREHNHPEVLIQCLPQFLRSLNDKAITAATLDEFSYFV